LKNLFEQRDVSEKRVEESIPSTPSNPTIYNFPKKSLTPKPVTEQTKQIWENHRPAKNKNTALPLLKN